ncbi:MAG TPA: lasso peptide biosynthesis B2 protein [Gemmatimonadales bacterium]|nr:lasso peptide biosynthesis B2 protein [Gemmatimonadales bacterium]
MARARPPHREPGPLNRLPVGYRVRALLFALAIPPALELLPFSRLARWLTRAPGPSRADVDDQALATWVDRILSRLPWPWRRTCLRRALVLYPLIRRAGRPVALTIGVRRDPLSAGVTAHAWLTLGEGPYLEADPAHPGRHTPIATFP